MAGKKTVKSETKRLVRVERNRMIAGICSGIARFFDIDPTIIRLVFVVVTLFGGSGVLIYIVLWLVIPNEKGKGEIDEESIKESTEEMKDKAKEFAESAKTYTKGRNPRFFLGIVLLFFGTIFLLDNLGFHNVFNLWRFWPVILIIIAVSILTKND